MEEDVVPYPRVLSVPDRPLHRVGPVRQEEGPYPHRPTRPPLMNVPVQDVEPHPCRNVQPCEEPVHNVPPASVPVVHPQADGRARGGAHVQGKEEKIGRGGEGEGEREGEEEEEP